MEPKDKTCANCQNLGFDTVRQFNCLLSNLPVEPSDTCDSFKEREEPVVKKKYAGLKITILLSITICLVIFVRYATNLQNEKEMKEFFKSIAVQQNRELHLYKYIKSTDTLGLKRYKGAFYTYEADCNQYRFEDAIYSNFYQLPAEINKYDTVVLENTLVHFSSDSTKTVLYHLKGFLIKFNNDRRYQKIE